MVGVAGDATGLVYFRGDDDRWRLMGPHIIDPQIIDGNYVVVSRDDGELLE